MALLITMNKTRRENGHMFEHSAYLVVPDTDIPASWLVRVEATPGVITQESLSYAASQITRKARGARTSMTQEQRSIALAKLTGLFVEHKLPLSASLAEAVTSDAFAQMQKAIRGKKNKKTIAEAMGVGEYVLEALTEAYFSCTYVAVVDDGAPSFESVCAAVSAALTERHKRTHLDPTSPSYLTPHPWDCDVRAVATLPGSVCYEMAGKLYQVSYTMAGTSATIGTDDNEIVMTPKDAPTTLGESDLTEGSGLSTFTINAPLFEGTIDKDAGVIREAVIINAKSANGRGRGGRLYSDKALRSLAGMAEGAPCFANHVTNPADAFKPRDIREALGKFKSVKFDESKHRVVGDLHLAEHQREWVLSLADSLGSQVGNSPVSRGVVRMEGETEVVDDIVALRSVDLVSDPATTRGLFEHREQWQAAHPSTQGEEIMTLAEIQAHLDKNPVEKTALRDTLFAEHIEKVKTDAVAAALKESNEKAEADKAKLVSERDKALADLKESNGKVDEFKAKDEAREKAMKLDGVLAESDLKKKFGGLKSAITQDFRDSLLALPEAEWTKKITDRVASLTEAVGQRVLPASQLKGDTSLTEGRGDNGIPADATQRMRRAFAA